MAALCGLSEAVEVVSVVLLKVMKCFMSLAQDVLEIQVEMEREVLVVSLDPQGTRDALVDQVNVYTAKDPTA